MYLAVFSIDPRFRRAISYDRSGNLQGALRRAPPFGIQAPWNVSLSRRNSDAIIFSRTQQLPPNTIEWITLDRRL